jgi:hypothetical protein
MSHFTCVRIGADHAQPSIIEVAAPGARRQDQHVAAVDLQLAAVGTTEDHSGRAAHDP